MKITLPVTTICVNCRWHTQSDGTTIHSHLCGHPSQKREKERNPVTGGIGYVDSNDRGTAFLSNDEYPACTTINSGNCKDYEPK